MPEPVTASVIVLLLLLSGSLIWRIGSMLEAQRLREEEIARRHQESLREAVSESASLLHLAVENVPASIAYFSARHVCMFANSVYAGTFGFTAQTIVGRSLPEIIGEEAAAAFQARLAAVVPGETLRYERNRGTNPETHLDVAVTPHLGTDRVVHGYFVLITDITERVRADAERRAGEMRLNALVLSALEAIIIVDAEQRIVLFNPAAELLFQRRVHEVLGRSVDILIPERHRKAHAVNVRRFRDFGITNRPMGTGGRIVGCRADGSEFPAEASIAQFAVGAEHHMAVMLRDVSKQVEAERKVLDLNLHLEELVSARTAQVRDQARIIDQIREAVVVTDLRARITRWSKGAEALYGYPAAAIVGRPIWQLYPPAERASRAAQINEQIRNRGWYEAQATEIGQAGQPVDVLVTVSVAHDEAGAATGYIGVALDITEIKRHEKALLEAKLAAERASRAKSEFLSRMSHELRTPLHAVLGFSQLLELELAGMAQRESAAEIQRAGKRLLAMISDLLDYSNIENGQITKVRGAVSAADAVGEAPAPDLGAGR